MHLMTWEDEVLGNEGSTLLFPSVSVLLFFVIWVNITLAAEDEAVVTFKKSEGTYLKLLGSWCKAVLGISSVPLS